MKHLYYKIIRGFVTELQAKIIRIKDVCDNFKYDYINLLIKFFTRGCSIGDMTHCFCISHSLLAPNLPMYGF